MLAVGWTAYLLNLAETTEKPRSPPFPVPPALVAQVGGRRVEERRDARTRSCGSRSRTLPAGVAPGIYLVDRATNEAQLRREDGIGAGRLQAPQAKLMSVVIDGLLTHKLPWDLILLGAAIAVFIELLGVPLADVRRRRVPAALVDDARVPRRPRAHDLGQACYKREPDAEDEPAGQCSGAPA